MMFEYTEEEKAHFDIIRHDIISRKEYPRFSDPEYWRNKMNVEYQGVHPTLEQIIDELECGFVGGEELI